MSDSQLGLGPLISHCKARWGIPGVHSIKRLCKRPWSLRRDWNNLEWKTNRPCPQLKSAHWSVYQCCLSVIRFKVDVCVIDPRNNCRSSAWWEAELGRCPQRVVHVPSSITKTEVCVGSFLSLLLHSSTWPLQKSWFLQNTVCSKNDRSRAFYTWGRHTMTCPKVK